MGTASKLHIITHVFEDIRHQMKQTENDKTIEQNIELIASLAEPHWADNWNFRAYLQRNVHPVKIDEKAIETYLEVSSQIDCTSCGNCCREIYPHMTPADTTRLATGLGKSEVTLLKMTTQEDQETRVFCDRPCPLLKENKCTAYEIRPDDCREYPHLHKRDFLGGSIGTIENYGTCPIVFNTYKRLKSSFNYDPTVDYIGDSDPETTHGSLYISESDSGQ